MQLRALGSGVMLTAKESLLPQETLIYSHYSFSLKSRVVLPEVNNFYILFKDVFIKVTADKVLSRIFL